MGVGELLFVGVMVADIVSELLLVSVLVPLWVLVGV